jgi:hypothetical protein
VVQHRCNGYVAWRVYFICNTAYFIATPLLRLRRAARVVVQLFIRDQEQTRRRRAGSEREREREREVY